MHIPARHGHHDSVLIYRNPKPLSLIFMWQEPEYQIISMCVSSESYMLLIRLFDSLNNFFLKPLKTLTLELFLRNVLYNPSDWCYITAWIFSQMNRCQERHGNILSKDPQWQSLVTGGGRILIQEESVSSIFTYSHILPFLI